MFIIKISALHANGNIPVPTSYMTINFEPQELEILITRVDDQLLQPSETVLTDTDQIFLEEVKKIVEQYLGKNEFNVKKLAAEMAMSPSSLYRRLKSITGQTCVEFVRNARLNRAANLLVAKHKRVSKVAHELGFSDMRYFRKAFQKRFGQAPSEYARQHRGDAMSDAFKQSTVN